MFDAINVTDQCVNWIKEFFNKNGVNCNAIIGISGGKDSSVVAALCVHALGKERVIGVLMPCGEQADIDMAYKLVNHLGIKHYEINVGKTVQMVEESISILPEISTQAKINIPARVRMTTLYAVAQSLNGRVANTCNLSEDWVGYATRYGDGAGDFSPLCNMTVTEVKEIGRGLGLPEELVEKTPIDGLCGKTDEENIGFTYAELDKYIRTGVIKDKERQARQYTIDKLKKWKVVYCFDRPAFRDPISQEGRMEDFDKAIEDTIIALNTGILRTRDGSILRKSEGKSSVNNDEWREKLNVIGDMLSALRRRLKIAKAAGAYSTYGEGEVMYCFSDRQLGEWFDSTREEIVKILSSICEEMGMPGLHFPRNKYGW